VVLADTDKSCFYVKEGYICREMEEWRGFVGCLAFTILERIERRCPW
jgi:hypothetical protein